MASSYRIPATRPLHVESAESLPPASGQRGALPMPRRMSTAAEGAAAAAVLSLVALSIHGYHPFAEDGGLYFSSVVKAAHLSLYPRWGEFVTVQTRYSLYAPLVAGLVRLSRLHLAVAIFLLHVLSIWATIFAGWLVAARCYASRQARYGAACLLALWLTIPIAGTSLLLMDPYLTARSISTPCGLFAMVAVLDVAAATRRGRPLPWRSVSAGILAISLASIVHPLMAGFIVCSLVLLFACSFKRASTRALSAAGLCLLAIAITGCLYRFGPAATPNYFRVEHTRDYWFLHEWHWYEIAGLVAPLLLLDLLTRIGMRHGREASRWIARMAIAAGVTAIFISLAFVRESSLSYEVARLQPLRIFHIIYIVMILILGAVAGERLLARRLWRWGAMFVLLGTVMLSVQLYTFPASAHLELPWNAPRNGWEQAFVWIGAHTPRNALFALDANYITYPGEDAQYFRAVAERSALPDYSKDGGLAAIDPRLADPWTIGQTAQAGLNSKTDPERLQALRPFGVSWIVLPAGANTNFPCPYRNAAAKACLIAADSR